MPKSIAYVTKVSEISAVEFEGEIRYDDDNGAWAIGEDNLEEWFERFKGKRVYLSIKTFERDESHLLPAEPAGYDLPSIQLEPADE